MAVVSKTRSLILLIVAVAIVALLLGLWVHRNTQGADQTKISTTMATVLNPARTIESFQLTSDTGKPFSKQNLLGHWSLLFFGFTHCPDLCPTTLSLLNKAYLTMQQQQLQPMPQVVFISVDPERDAAPGVIKQYLSSFNSQFIGATGKQSVLNQLTQSFSVVTMKVMNKDSEHGAHYTIDHSGVILLVDPKAELYAIFSTPHNPAIIAKDVEHIIKRSKKS